MNGEYKLTARERREKIRELLEYAPGPLSAARLAKQLGVSRQIVVGDVALLRAGGCEVESTPRGYVRGGRENDSCREIIACRHTGEEALRQELYCVVDNGATLVDVMVENPLYGELTGQLHIANRYDADQFIRKAHQFPDGLVSRTTGGVHLHTVSAPDRECLDRVRRGLAELGILYEK